MITCTEFLERKIKMGYPALLLLLSLYLSLELNLGMGYHPNCEPTKANDKDRIQFAANLEYLETEYFSYGSVGKGIDELYPYLAHGGPPPIGVRKANLDPLTQMIFEEFALQEYGHLRAIDDTVGLPPRPRINLSPQVFSNTINAALGYKLEPPFDPYLNPLYYMLGAYYLPYLGLVGYVGTIPYLEYYVDRRLVSGLLGVEAQQDETIRTLLYEKADEIVEPYNITVAEFTNLVSMTNNKLAMCGIRNEGIIVPPELGAENRTKSNIIAADEYSLSYSRTPQEILRVLYGTGNESEPGGFLPHGGSGNIAQRFLRSPY